MVAVRLGDFVDQAVCTQQTQLAGDGRGLPTFFPLVLGFAVQQAAQIAIAEAVDGELAPVNRFQQTRVFFGQGVQTTRSFALPSHWFANRFGQFSQRMAVAHRGQPLDVAFVGSLANLGPALNVGYSFPQALPTFRAIFVPFLAAIHLHVPRVVDDGFDTQHRTLLVVHLDPIGIEAMLDSRSFDATLQVGDHFAFELPMQPLSRRLTSQKAHHVTAVKMQPRVAKQTRCQFPPRPMARETPDRSPTPLRPSTSNTASDADPRWPRPG